VLFSVQIPDCGTFHCPAQTGPSAHLAGRRKMYTPKFNEGDLIAQLGEGGAYVAKVLKVDLYEYEEETSGTYHLRLYHPVPPEELSSSDLQLQTMHAPIDSKDIDENWSHVGNNPVLPDELYGFHHYLRVTDFGRYLQETGQNIEEILTLANSHFTKGCELSDKSKHEEAIQEYTAAIEIFPMLYEAIDNMGLSKMDLGRFDEALHDFHQSMQIEGDNPLSLFSAGECLLKMNRAIQALPYFEECVTRWPKERFHREYLKIAKQEAERSIHT
jgi:tetratricopeptide (TPR) repeat protein